MAVFEILAHLRDEDRARVLACTRRRDFARGEVLIAQGAAPGSLLLIDSGLVAVRADTESGATALVALHGPGSSVGELALLDDSPRVASVVGIEPGTALSLSRGDFDELVRRAPQTREVLLRALAAKVRNMTDQLVEARHVPAERRVMRCLTEVAALSPGGSGEEAEVHLTQDDLAGLAGTTRETVNRVLRANAATVRTQRGRLWVRRA